MSTFEQCSTSASRPKKTDCHLLSYARFFCQHLKLYSQAELISDPTATGACAMSLLTCGMCQRRLLQSTVSQPSNTEPSRLTLTMPSAQVRNSWGRDMRSLNQCCIRWSHGSGMILSVEPSSPILTASAMD